MFAITGLVLSPSAKRPSIVHIFDSASAIASFAPRCLKTFITLSKLIDSKKFLISAFKTSFFAKCLFALVTIDRSLTNP